MEEIDNEAAAWIARLNADRRTPADAAAFQAWLAQSPAHASAFEEATTVWDLAGAVPRGAFAVPRPRRHLSRRELAAGLAVTAVAASSMMFWGRAEAKVFETKVGEARRVVFADESTAMLDTDTRIVVRYGDSDRRVDLERGRVNFHVTADAARPFIVSGAQETITTQRSDFDVRRDGEKISVVLIAGDAAVESGGRMTLLQSGQRLVASSGATRLDKPSLLPLLAWRKGQAILENEKLADAIREMNRYSQVKLTLGDDAIADLRVSGVYKVGDSLGFARSIARLLPLRVRQSDDKVLLFFDAGRMRQG
jgi:transmembrane sensor